MNQSTYSAPAAYRTLEILEYMTKKQENINITDIAKELKISTNSTFRILKELEKKGYVEKDLKDSTYYLTSKLYFLGRRAGKRIPFRTLAIPFMKELSKITRETVLLATLTEKGDTLLIEEIESPEPIKFISDVGKTYDSYASAFGKVMLAFSNNDVINTYISNTNFSSLTEFTITNKETFKNELIRIKKQGYATDEEESSRGLQCIAFPIFNEEGNCIGSIGISALSFRLGISKFNEYLPIIKETSQNLSIKCGAFE